MQTKKKKPQPSHHQFEPPFRSVSFSPSFRETDVANLFLTCDLQNPRVRYPFFRDTRCHARWLSTHVPSQISRQLVVLETNAADFFFGLRCVKSKKSASIFSLTRLHARPEVLPSTHTPAIEDYRWLCCSDSEEPMPSSSTFISKKDCFCLLLSLKTQMANFLTVGSLFLPMSGKWTF